jgi:hypothetical protein
MAIYGHFELKDSDGAAIDVSYSPERTELMIGYGNLGLFISHKRIKKESDIEKAVMDVVKYAGDNLTYNGSDKLVHNALQLHLNERASGRRKNNGKE